jgi:peptide/nickel transport system permease protein
VHGDLGQSIATSRPVLQELLTRVPATLELMLFAFVLSATAGLTLGVVTAVTRGRAPDVLLRVTAVVGISTPTFWLGLVLLLVFYNWLGWLPGSGRLDAVLDPPARVSGLFLVDSALAGDWLAWRSAFNHLLLPALTLALASTGAVMRLVRASMLEALGEDYIRTARAAGLPMHKVVLGHALRNALIPFITLLGLELASLLFGSVIVESVFSWPGVGRFVLESILRLDFPVIMGFAVLAAFAYVIANLVTDLLYMAVDPRIREVH